MKALEVFIYYCLALVLIVSAYLAIVFVQFVGVFIEYHRKKIGRRLAKLERERETEEIESEEPILYESIGFRTKPKTDGTQKENFR